MTIREKTAKRMIKEAAGYVVGGYENTLMDFTESDEDYIIAKERLADHNGLIEEIYAYLMDMADGMERTDLRFLGREWLQDAIGKRLVKWDY